MNTDPDFAFNLSAPRTQFTNKQIIHTLRAFAHTRRGRPFSYSDFHAWKDRPFSIAIIIKRFGSWSKGLAAAGLRLQHPQRYDPETLMATLALLWRKLERPPGRAYLQRHAHISSIPYERIWGTLSSACHRLAAFQQGKISRDQLLYPPPPTRTLSPTPARLQVQPKLRYQILKRDNHRCTLCGRSPRLHHITLEVDHITPVSEGGTNNPKNLRTTCRACNRGRGGKRRTLKRRAHKDRDERPQSA